MLNKENLFKKQALFFLALGFWVVFFGAGYFLGKAMYRKPAISFKPVSSVNKSAVPAPEQALADNKAKETETYRNENFGFELEMTSSWLGFKAKETLLGGDFNLAEVGFSLGGSDLFIVSVYLKESWEDVQRNKENDAMLGELIGENETYVFLYSHLNGDPPAEISRQAVLDMDTIVKNIKTFSPVNMEPDKAVSAKNEANLLFEDYKSQALFYGNCDYRYSLYYPDEWILKESDSDIKIEGEGIAVFVKAQKTRQGLEEFASTKIKEVGGKAVDSRAKERFGVNILAYELESPQTVFVFWREGDFLMEFKIWGDKYKENQSFVGHLVTGLTFNQDQENCN